MDVLFISSPCHSSSINLESLHLYYCAAQHVELLINIVLFSIFTLPCISFLILISKVYMTWLLLKRTWREIFLVSPWAMLVALPSNIPILFLLAIFACVCPLQKYLNRQIFPIFLSNRWWTGWWHHWWYKDTDQMDQTQWGRNQAVRKQLFNLKVSRGTHFWFLDLLVHTLTVGINSDRQSRQGSKNRLFIHRRQKDREGGRDWKHGYKDREQGRV